LEHEGHEEHEGKNNAQFMSAGRFYFQCFVFVFFVSFVFQSFFSATNNVPMQKR